MTDKQIKDDIIADNCSNGLVYKQLDGYGMLVSYMGIVGEDFNKNFKLTKKQIGDSGDTNIKYKLAFIN